MLVYKLQGAGQSTNCMQSLMQYVLIGRERTAQSYTIVI